MDPMGITFVRPDGTACLESFLEANLEWLLDNRGGCRCQDPNASPPCNNCTSPITDSEASEMLSGWIGIVPKVVILDLLQQLIDDGHDNIKLE